ncbi:MAG: hypothetical protein HY686_04985 [Chloroflexi bacterium]|nr:hypothetical protein [Chloroflexota bacterium]
MAERVGDLVVIGGGCYGAYHARQLARACRAGRPWRRSLVATAWWAS